MESLSGAINQAKGLGIEEGRAQKLSSTRDVEVDPEVQKTSNRSGCHEGDIHMG